MKKILSIVLCTALMMTMLCVVHMTVGAYDFPTERQSNFNSGFYNIASGGIYDTYFQFAKNSAATALTKSVERAANDNAASITVTGNISEHNAPALQWALCNGGAPVVAGNAVTVSADVNIVDFDATENNSDYVFGFEFRGSAGWYNPDSNNDAFCADETIGGNAYLKNHWYNLAITLDFLNSKRYTVLTDLETGIKTVTENYAAMNENFNDLMIVHFALYCPATVLVDNTTIKQAPTFGIYSPAENASLEISGISSEFCVPSFCESAALYLDGTFVQNVTPSGNDIQTASFTPSEIGEHILVLTGEGAEENFYDEVKFTTTAKSASTLVDFGFYSTSEYWIGQMLSGGIAGHAHSLTYGDDTIGDKVYQYNTFTFTSKDLGNDPVFVRYGVGLAGSTEFDISLVFKTSQTNEKLAFQLEQFAWIEVLDSNGCFTGTNIPYSADTWYEAKIRFSMDGNYAIFIDGTQISSGAVSPVTQLGGVRIYMYGNNNDNAAFSIDNLKIDALSSLPEVTTVKGIKNQEELDVISTDASAVKVTFNDGIDLSSAIVSVLSNGEEVQTGTPSYDSNTFTVTIPMLEEIAPCAPLNIVFSGLKTSAGSSFGYPYVLRKESGVGSTTNYGTLTINKIGTTVTGAVEVYAAEPGNVVIIIAGYDNNEMVSVETKVVSVDYGKNVISLTGENMEGSKFAAYLWNSLFSVTPLTEPAVTE